jgi:cyclophilin family peptidyl-prolyl cis-trans isomerase
MRKMKTICLVLLAMSFAVPSFAKEKKKKTKLEPGMYAEITTSKGVILIQLEFEKTPMTVANFVGLAEGKFKVFDSIEFTKPFYDGLKFHRVIKDFMVQGGDPLGTGAGDPGYKFYDETRPDLKHTGPGILSMANSGPATNGSQFFITHKETAWLDGKHTIFGHVIMGQDIVDLLVQDDLIQTVKIIRKGKAAKKFKATAVFKLHYDRIAKEFKDKAEEIERISKMPEMEYKAYMFEQVKLKYPNAKQSESGLVYVIDEEGAGKKAAQNDKMSVHYIGTFRTSGDKFDSSRDREQPMDFNYQVQRMIPGFEEGLGMFGTGGKGKLIIPYYQAYGAQGRPGAIPPYSDLVFDVEIIDITDGPANEGHNEQDGHNHDANDGHNH